MSDLNFSVVVRGGGLLAPDAIRPAIERTMAATLQEASAILTTALQAASPVKTGALRADWHAYAKPTWDGSGYGLAIFNNRPYAPIVQNRGRSAGYVDRGLAQGKDAAIAAIKRGGVALAEALWVPTP